MDAADRLFYMEGVRATGIDRVLAEAEAAKASLYTHFGSKDELIAAYLAARAERGRESMLAYVEDVPAAERALRVFDYVAEWARGEQFRGCPMQLIAGELSERDHPARRCATEHRAWLLAQFETWARDANASDPSELARALLVLFDGAAAACMLDGPARAVDARWAAERLIRAAQTG